MDSSQVAPEEIPPTPPNFKTIKQIDELDNESLKKQIFVNVIGFVKDFQTPVNTRGTDWKCTLKIVDHSIPDQPHGMAVNIFWPEASMPSVSESNSMILIRNAKVQMRAGAVSLLANKKTTEFHIIPSSKITQDTKTLSADWRVFSLKQPTNPLNPLELSYIKWANGRSDELALPSEVEFQTRVFQSGNGRDKFSLLKDTKPDCFYNILGQVVKIYDPATGAMTIYLSDYTANSSFYNYAWGGELEKPDGRDGDPHGYIKSAKKEGDDWPGPYGKLTVQLTLYDGHARFVRDSVKPNDWVLLSNVKIGYGKNGGLLEGFLRGDQGAYDGKIQVKIMEQAENPEGNDTRWKEAVRRRHDWWKKFKKQKQELLDEAAGLSSKRKSNDGEPSKDNSKKRRKERRAAGEKKLVASQVKSLERLNLNENIKCNFPDRTTCPIKEILKPEIFRTQDGKEYESPFTIRKYRANVRVIDYYPHRIEDFAIGRRSSDMDILSDYSGGEDTDPEEERRLWEDGKGFAKNIWEWRFELLVEDASSQDKERLWLTVDNRTAQGLLAMDADATSLRGNHDLLAKLKEQLFKLWGDLEEQKSAKLELEQTKSKSKKDPPPSTFDSIISSPPPARKAGAQPDADSDVENESPKHIPSKNPKKPALAERDVNSSGPRENGKSMSDVVPRNKAFTCCIKQYGIMVDEKDPAKATAGNGKRWQRKFGIFDTFIV